jgi:hypothetical protein
MRNRLTTYLAFAALAVIPDAAPLAAQSLDITWSRLGGGGTLNEEPPMAPVRYGISASLGQPAAGPLTAPPQDAATGFWNLAVARILPRGDFSRDGHPDLVWRHDFSGENVVWLMNGVDLVSGTFTNPSILADDRWKIVGTNDFNADGQSDLLWRHTSSGENVVWLMNGVNLVSGTFTTPSALTDVRWRMVGTGDFNGDYRPDILWRHDVSGENVLWYMNGTELVSGTFTNPPSLPDTNWKMAGVSDFNGDNHPDIVWHHQVSGEVVLWYMNGANLVSGTFTSPSSLPDTQWRIMAVADFNSDQKPDLVWRQQFSGQNVVWFMDNATLVSGTFTNPSTLADTRWQLAGPR